MVDAAPSRVEAQCNHYDHDECGGCQLQHLDYGAQLEAKRRIVGDALRRIGKLDIADPSIVPAPDPWRYRTKVTLAATESKIGFHQFDRPASVFALERCLIAEENLMDLWQQVRSHRALLPQGLERIVLRSDREGGQHVILEDAREEVWDAAPFVAALGVDHISVWWRPSGGAARIVAGRKTGFPALAFEQGHPALAEALRHRLVEMAGDVTDQIVWDLYAGVGDTAVLLADRDARVWSVDSDRSAIAWGERALSHEHITRLAERAEDVLHRLPEPAAVVVNPPRTGLGKEVTSWLARWGREEPGRRLLYVSCDPATLARDLTRMPSFELGSVEAFDMFPQTSHVETLVVAESR